MNIKQAAQKSGISERNIRYYEQAGLITPARNPDNDYRQYTEENMRTLKMIRILRSVDMPVEDIRDVLQGKTALSDAALAQKQRLQDRMQTLKAAADFCSELNETCCSADALEEFLEDFEIIYPPEDTSLTCQAIHIFNGVNDMLRQEGPKQSAIKRLR